MPHETTQGVEPPEPSLPILPVPDTPNNSPGTLPEGRDPLGRREPTPTDSQITTPASAPPAVHDASGAIPAQFGRYELEREIARGGMGAVFAARDTRFDREVAVKLLLDHHSPGSFAARRFVFEARITGQLQHPGIPAVHDLGELPDGRPFLAMKLIKGRTLDHLLKQRETPAVDRGRFLAVFEGICQAVGYAHAHRVIHRDLKPLNVMVGAFGEVQVMDWGLAKVLGVQPAGTDTESQLPEPVETEIRSHQEEDEAKREGSVLGTPAYMPPEQATGAVDQIDTRSDVFGLGAILCVMLTGKPPYVGSSSEATRQLAARGQLADAFGRLDHCEWEPELVSLCKRCLSVEKGDRPDDARRVAEAVQTFRLESEARARQAELDRIHAEGEVHAAELKATELRKRRRVQLALLGTVGLLLVAGAGFAWWQEKQTADRRRVESDLREAELKGQLADEQERSRLARNRTVIASLLDQCAAALRAEDTLRAVTLLEQAEKRAAEGGGEEFAATLAGRRSEVTLLMDLDQIDSLQWAVVQGKILGTDEAVAKWPGAFARYGIELGKTSPDVIRQRLEHSPIRDRILGALDQWHARSPSPALLDILQQADPDEFRDAVRLALSSRNKPQIMALLSRPTVFEQPPRFTAEMGQLGVVPIQRRLQILLTAVAQRPADYALLMTLGALYDPDSKATAPTREKWYRAAVAARSSSAAACTNLALALADREEHEQAIPYYEQAIRNDQKLPHPRINMGVSLAELGKLELAISSYWEAIRLDPKNPGGHLNLGNALLERGEVKAALASLREAVRLGPKVSLAHNGLGNVLAASGDEPGAEAAYRTAIELDPEDARPHYNLGRLYRQQKKLDAAIACFEHAVELDPKATRPVESLGTVRLARGEFAEAVAAFRQVVKLNPNTASAHGLLASALFKSGELPEAITEFQTAIRLDPKLAAAHTGLGAALYTKRELPRAATALTEAIKLDPKDPESHYNLGLVRRDQKNWDAAMVCFRETVRLNPKFAPAHNNLAIGLYLKRDFDGAIAAIREAIKHDPTEPGYRMNLDRFLKAKAERDGKDNSDPKK